jgi:hypothetical protein
MSFRAHVADMAFNTVSAAIIREDARRIAFAENIADNAERHRDIDSAIARVQHLEETIDIQGFPTPNIVKGTMRARRAHA